MPPGVRVGRAGGGGFPEHRAEGLPAPCGGEAPARLHRHPQGRLWRLQRWVAPFLGPYPQKAGPASLPGQGCSGEPFRGFSGQEHGTSPQQHSSGQVCPGRPRGGEQTASGGKQTPQLQGAEARPRALDYRAQGPEETAPGASSRRPVCAAQGCAVTRPTRRALPPAVGTGEGVRPRGHLARVAPARASMPPLPPLWASHPPRLPLSLPFLTHQPNSNSPKAASSYIPSFSSP